MKLALAGGGTGGHLAPGIALMEGLQAGGGTTPLLFFTVRRSTRFLRAALPGCRRIVIPAATIRLRQWRELPRSLFLNWRGYRQSYRVLKRDRPEVMIGLGGYASVPPVLAASRLGIPVVLHEQNTVLGRANRFLTRRAVRVALSFPLREGGDKAVGSVLIGSPVRRAARDSTAPDGLENWGREAGKFTVLIVGGSGGARFINRLFEESVGLWGEEKTRLRFIHLTGQEEEASVSRAYRLGGVGGVVRAYCAEMGWAYSQADLVVGRAGGATLNEVAFWGLPSILVPYPWAADRHQLSNARYFEAAGAAVVCEQKETNARRLVETILGLKRDRERLRVMSEKAKSLYAAKPQERFVELLQEVIGAGEAKS